MRRTLFYVCLLILFAHTSYSQTCVTGGTLSSSVYHDVFSQLHDATISGLRINTSSTSCIVLRDCYNVTISNCILGPSHDYGVYLYNCHNITIVNCSFMNNYGGVYAESCTGIRVDNNQFANVRGGFPRGQYVQFNGVTGAGNEIKNNVGENVFEPCCRAPQDLINLYMSSGTAASPILIDGNKLRGGGPSGSGGGIMTGDNGGDYQTVQNNILVDPGQYGIAVAGGNNNSLLNNKVYGRLQHFTNVGMYVSKMPGASTCNNILVQGNAVNYTDSIGVLSPFWPDVKTCSGIGDINNNWNATFGPEILPDRLLCPLLMAYYKFNANWNDASGSGLNGVSNNGAFGGQGVDWMCANFDGSQRYIALPSSPWLQAQSERFTVSCWIKPNTLTGVQGIAQAQNSDGFYSGWRMVLNGAALNGHLVTDAGTVDIYCGGIQQGSWAHVVMVYDGKSLKGYVNGVLQASAAITGNVSYPMNTPSTIGYCNGTNYLNAFLDEFKFYDGALTDAEVLADYNANAQAVNMPQPETRVYYSFNNNWTDGSGNGLTAVTHGAGFVCNGAGSYSASLGGGSYLTVPSSALLDPYSSVLTVACWIKPATVTGIKGIAQAQNSDGYNNGWRALLLDGTFNARVVTNAGPIEVYCGGIQAGVWNYVVMTYDGQSLKGYVNGALQATSPWGGYIVYSNTSSAMQIGLCNGTNYYFSGYMDEFKFFDGPLSATAIQQEYNTMYPVINATPNCPSSNHPVSDIGSPAMLSDAGDSGGVYIIRPDPAAEEITVTGTPAHQRLYVELYNTVGQLVRSDRGSSDGLILRVSDLTPGVYLLRIDNGNMVTTRKVVVQR